MTNGTLLRNLTGAARAAGFRLALPLIAAIVVFAVVSNSFDRADRVVAEQTLVVSGLGYTQLPAVHEHHEGILGSTDPDAAVTMIRPFGEHATTFILQAEAEREADALVDVRQATAELLAPDTARQAAVLFSSPTDTVSKLADVERQLEAATNRLDAARERRSSLDSIGAAADRIEAASQDSWSAANERDVLIRRATELQIEMDAELAALPYQVSTIGATTSSVVEGAQIGILAGALSAVVAGALALVAVIHHTLRRQDITCIEQARLAAHPTPVVNLSLPDSTAGVAHLRRLTSGGRPIEVIANDVDLTNREWDLLRHPDGHQGPSSETRATTGPFVLCARIGTTSGSTISRELTRLRDESVEPVAVIVFPDTDARDSTSTGSSSDATATDYTDRSPQQPAPSQPAKTAHATVSPNNGSPNNGSPNNGSPKNRSPKNRASGNNASGKRSAPRRDPKSLDRTKLSASPKDR